MAASPLPTEEGASFAFHHESPHSLRQLSTFSSQAVSKTDHDHNCSGVEYDENTSATDVDDPAATEEEEEEDPDGYDHLTPHLDYSADEGRRSVSGHSSISSFPASTISHGITQNREPYGGPRTPTGSPLGGVLHYPHRRDFLGSKAISPRSARDYHSAFRNPSSVRAMQMRDEAFDDAESVLRRHKRSDSRLSSHSHRSSFSVHTSPAKRSSRSTVSSIRAGDHLKKEYPLVLLHCTILPPRLLPQGVADDDGWVGELLPEGYKQRWAKLRDKLVVDPEIRTRGILIAHPQDDYELLEDRLLESLELEQPRIRHSHFFQRDQNSGDSGFESESHTEDEREDSAAAGMLSNDIECPDCGRRIRSKDSGRRWSVKVFAANGLMRAGAWCAAWREMEKIDVEISLALPEDVRRELEARLAALATQHPDAEHGRDLGSGMPMGPVQSAREREIYGESGRPRSQDDVDDGLLFPETRAPAPGVPVVPQARRHLPSYLETVIHDRKNAVIAILSLLVLFYAFSRAEGMPRTAQSPLVPAPETTASIDVLTTTVTAVRTAISTTTMTAMRGGDDTTWSIVVSPSDGSSVRDHQSPISTPTTATSASEIKPEASEHPAVFEARSESVGI